MRKLLVWILVALMAFTGFAYAEPAGAPVVALNGTGATRIGEDLYLAIPDGTRQMLMRVPSGSGDPVCIDRADLFEDIIPYGNGILYLKTDNGSSAVMNFDGTYLSAVYAFGTSEAGSLSYYNGQLLVLIDGLLHSIDPSSKLCLRMSGAAMLDYVLDGSMAYFLSGGDRMEYTGTLDDGETVSAQGGCIYSLDLNTGETELLLKNGGQDLQIADGQLYFHNLADAYAARVAGTAELRGHVQSLDISQRSLATGCSEPDNGFWALSPLVVWYNGALNMQSEAGSVALYTPEAQATVVSDGTCLYVWEPGQGKLTQLLLNGTQTVVYSGDLLSSVDLTLTMPSPTPTVSAIATVGSEGVPALFDGFVPNDGASATPNLGAWTQATPIGASPTPQPTPLPQGNATAAPTRTAGSGNSGATSTLGTTQSGSTYSVSISYLRITGGAVNVRSGPGTGYSVVGTVYRGAVVPCTGTGAKDNHNNSWYQIRYNGSKRWISAGYAQRTSAPDTSYVGPEESMSGSGVTVTGSSVNVRARPNLSGTKLGVVRKGSSLTFLGARSVDSRGVAWYKVSYGGNTGWISSVYSRISGTGSNGGSSAASGTLYTTGSVYVRTGPGRDYASRGTLPRGTAFTVTARQNDARGVTWYQGSGGGKSGWVSSVYLSTVKPSTDGNGGSSSASGTLYTTGSVNVRTGPGLDYASSGTLPRGTAFSVTATQKDARGVSWYRGSGGGKSGWVSSVYLSTTLPPAGGSGSAGGSSSASGTLYTTGSVNVRTGPGLDYASSGTLPRGTAFSVTATQKDARGVSWYRGSGGGKSGWVSSAYLSTSKPSSGSSGSAGGSTLVTTGQLTIRSRPDKTSPSLGYIGSGKTVTYLNNSSQDSRGVTWYFISYGGTKGWISSRYCYFR